MHVRITQNSFTSGEIGKAVDFRSDIDLYRTAVKRLENFFVLPQGPLRKRPGLKRLNSTRYDAVKKLIPFVFSTVQSYVFALEDSLLRVFRTSDDTQQFSGATPWTAAQLPTMRWTQSFDTFIGFHPDVAPTKIVRNGSDAAWTISTLTYDYLPYFRFSDTLGISITPSATTGTITLTASAALFDTSGNWVGKSIRFTNKKRVHITAWTSTTVVTAVVDDTLASTSADAIWEEQAWSSHRGWPIVGSFHQNRLVIAGTKSLPQTVFLSRSGDFFNFNDATGTGTPPAVLDTDEVEVTLSSNEVNAALDLFSVRGNLQTFTTAAEWLEKSKPITPTQVSFDIQTRHGMSNSGIRVVSVDSETLFVDRTQKQLRGLNYQFQTDSYTARNLTVTAPDILVSPTTAAYLRSYSDSQSNYVFLRNSDGTLVGISIDSDQKIAGWFHFNGVATFQDICVVNDSLYALASWNGHQYLAKMTDDTYVDLWESKTGSATTAWSGFTTFANSTITVVGDGYVFDGVAVDGSGNFTLTSAVATVYAGLPYTAIVETLALAPAVNGQLLRGERIRKVKTEVTVRNTEDLWIDGQQVFLRKLGVGLLDKAITQQDVTIEKRLHGISGEPTVVIESRNALPCQIQGITTQINLRNP